MSMTTTQELQAGNIVQYRKVGKASQDWVVVFLTGPRKYKELGETVIWTSATKRI
jgi:hypothetical protein